MRKTLFSLLGAGLALMLVVQACGPDDRPMPPAPDGGSWVLCEGTDAGVCAPGESCVYVDLYERALCVRPCDATLGCEEKALLCCAGNGDGGVGGYCMPREVCEPPDAGSLDAGADPEPGKDAGTEPPAPQDGGSDAGTTGGDAGTRVDAGTNPNPGADAGTNPGTDAGTWVDAGTNPGTDAGTWVDAGTDAGSWVDAGTSMDAGTGADGGSPPDAGADGGTFPDAGTDAGFPGDAGTDGGTSPDAGTPPPTFARIRIMASNLTSGNNQSYDPGHGNRLMQGVSPDIVLIQEFNYGDNSATAIRNYVTNIFGASFQYHRETGAQIPNGIISRWPILAAGQWNDGQVSNRDYAWARIDIPGPKDLWAVSVHLWSNGGTTGRNAEANELVNYIRANVPAGDYLVLGGDLNTDNRSEPCLSTLSQVLSVAEPHPADQNGNTNTNLSRAKPYDHVLADGDLRPYQVPTVIGASTYANGLVLDSRVYTPLSEVAPVQYGDSSATNMQHMGVVKDFRVPAN